MTTPTPPTPSGAQRWTAAMMTPVGIIAILILLPIVVCCGFCLFSAVYGSFTTPTR